MESSEDEAPCWVKGCKGDHDQYFHPVHNCLPPVTPATAKRRRDHGQEVRNVVRSRLPAYFTCECGKRWTQTTNGWEQVYDYRH